MNRFPPGRATSRSSITTITGLASIPPYAPAIPDKTFTRESSVPRARRLAIHVAAPPPMDPRAFSGHRLAPPMSETADMATIAGTSRAST